MAKRKTGHRRKRKDGPATARAWIPGTLFLLAVGLYLQTVQFGFVFDDVTLILQNPAVVNLNWSELLAIDGYRPVRTLTYGLNYLLGGEDPSGYHFFNVVLHGANGILVFLLVWLLTQSNLVAGLAGLFFVVHPAQTAAVAYISGRKDLLATFFILIGCVVFLRYRKELRESWKLKIYLVVTFVLALLSKEVAIVFPALLLVLVSFGQQGTPGKVPSGENPVQSIAIRIRRNLLLYSLLLVLASIAAYWALFVSEASRKVGFWGGTFETNLGTSFKLFVHYLKLVLVPYPLVADYTGSASLISSGFLQLSTLISVIVALGFLAAALMLFRRHPLLSTGMLWFGISLAPVLQFIPFHELAADHFMYLPLVGMSLIFGRSAQVLIEKGMRLPAWGAVGVLTVTFSIITLIRTPVWTNELTLWEATLEQAPESYRANVNLGYLYFEQGRVEEGLALTKKSTALMPGEPEPWVNLGTIFYRKGQEARQTGDLEQALEFQRRALENTEKAIEINPYNPFSYNNLANSFKELALISDARGDSSQALQQRIKAVEHYKKALNMGDPRREVQAIWLNLGNLLVDGQHYDQAVFYLSQFLKAYPENSLGNYWMGYCYFEMEDYEKAVPHFEKAVSVQPEMRSWEKLAQSFERLGRDGKAIEVYLRALRYAPGSIEVRYNLGVLYHRVGQSNQALRYFHELLRMSPDGPYSPRVREMIQIIEMTD